MPENSIHKDVQLRDNVCRCPEPAGDPRDLTCCYCGRQVGGVPLPDRPIAFPYLIDGAKPAAKRPKYRMAA